MQDKFKETVELVDSLIKNPRADFRVYIEFEKKVNIKSFIGDVLEYYGGGLADKVLLKLWEVVREYSDKDWAGIINKCTYNRVLAEESFCKFFYFHSGINNNDSFNRIHIRNIPIERNYSSDYKDRNDVLYEELNLDSELIDEIRSFTEIRSSQNPTDNKKRRSRDE